jgi:DNA-binding transcriptional LysR family regulator
MRYTFGQAEAFYWVARLGGFRAAANHLNLSQPTVSLRVKELERILGDELFDRSLYRPTPTTLGSAIYADVERMLSHAEQVQRRSKDAQTTRGLLRIGAADSFAALILPGLLASLAHAPPVAAGRRHRGFQHCGSNNCCSIARSTSPSCRSRACMSASPSRRSG